MSTRSVLINYPGYPTEIRSLAPDNGLANLAAVLIHQGHRTTILDYATVETIEKLFPHEYKNKLSNLTTRVISSLKKGSKPSARDFALFHNLDEQIDELQKKRTVEIAREISDYVTSHRIDFVGIKLWLGDGFEGSMMIAKELKRNNPQLPIFAGGPHVDSFREKILDVCDVFDALVYGEGEETITFLAEYVQGKRKLENIPNLIYKNKGNIITTTIKRVGNLNNLPPPIYDEDIYPAMKNDQKIKMIFIEESRGCPNHCSYCIHPLKSGNKWRLANPDKIVNQLEEIKSKYGIKIFRFTGSNSPPSLKKRIADEILKKGLKVSYTAFGHIRDGLVMDFQALKKSGCYSLFFGIESGSQEILDGSMNKGTKISEIRNTISTAKKSGLYVVGSVIIPAPRETEETKKETLNLLLTLRPDSVVVWFPALMLGTDWEKNSEKYGFEIENRRSFFEQAMLYKIKSFYPQDLWKSCPEYKLNGKSFSEITKETGVFIQLLERNNILTQVTGETALLANCVGMSPREFKDKEREYFSAGDYQRIGELVKAINQKKFNYAC